MLDNVFWRVIFVFGLKKGNVKNVLSVCVLNSILCYELVNVFVRIKKKKAAKKHIQFAEICETLDLK